MKLVHPDLTGQLILDTQRPCKWIIESPKAFTGYVRELWGQTEGREGAFVLSDSGQEKAISKCMEMIINPLDIQVNDKKIINKLYNELTELAVNEEMFLITQEFKSNLLEYFWKLEYHSPYMLEPGDEIDMLSLWKAIGLKILDDEEDWLGNLHQYIQILSKIFCKQVIALVNIESYCDERQIEELHKTAMHHEMALLLIENVEKELSYDRYCYIIDRDGCEIYS